VAKSRVQGGLWMLAKIAHAAAVAELGLNGAIAEPLLPPSLSSYNRDHEKAHREAPRPAL
jgi:hypothetical protein